MSKRNLLDFVRNFVVHDREGGRLIKKVARYQQFEAVNRAVDGVQDAHGSGYLRDRGGIIWHTQGSGKSLTMLWLAVKLRRLKLAENPTLLVVTDRKSLDRQITMKFEACGFENPQRAASINHLRKMLVGPPGQTVMTTVHKFFDKGVRVRGKRISQHPELCQAKNIFVLVDEAHRSEYGWLHAHMRKALPNACLFAFTGTPIPKTQRVFGSYIHTYRMPEAIADGVTKPIKYESRLPELAVWGNRIDPIFEAQFPDLTKEQKTALKKQELTERAVAETQDRIAAIAFDICEHYKTNFEADGFKAQVVTCSQQAAGMYHTELSKYFPGKVALLISPPPGKGDSKLAKQYEPYSDEDAVIDQFVDPQDDSLLFIVVCDKYITGFDAPIERVMYLDKPLREHNLLQAIARVNRPLPEMGKDWGLIVDYWGVAGFLDRALAAFDELDIDEVMQPRRDDETYRELKERLGKTMAIFPADLERRSLEPWVLAVEDEDRRAEFLTAYRAFYKTLEQLLPDDGALVYLKDFDWLRRVRRATVSHYCMEDLGLADASEKVRALLDQHIRAGNVTVLLEPVDILSERFTAEVQKLESNRAKASRMEHEISRTTRVKMAEDPAFYMSVQERLQQIILDHKQQRIDDVTEFKLLMRVREDIVHGRGETAASLGVGETEFAFYNLITRYWQDAKIAKGANMQSPVLLAKELVQELEGSAVIDWVHKDDVQREMRRQAKRRLRLAGCPPEQIEPVTTALMDLARVRLAR